MQRIFIPVLFIIFIACRLIESEDFILCSPEEYVRVGLEFQACQSAVLSPDLTSADRDDDYDMCPNFVKIIKICSKKIKHCFKEKAYKRGLLIILDSLATNFPAVKDCRYITTLRNESETADLKEEEQCSIDREMSLATEIRMCSNGIHRDLLSHLQGGKTAFAHLATQNRRNEYFRELMCNSVDKIRRTCYEDKLRECYDTYDARVQMALYVTNLRTTADIIAVSTTNVTDFSDNCPAFSLVDSKASAAVVAAVTLIAVVAVGVVIGSLVVLGKKTRALPRMIAWFGNLPYKQQQSNASGIVNAEVTDPNIRAMERRNSEMSDRSDEN